MGWPGERMRHSCSSRGILTKREQERVNLVVDGLGAFVTTVVTFSGAGGRSIDLSQVPPVELSQQVQNQARLDLINSSWEVQNAIIESAQGTFVGFKTRVDYGFDKKMQEKEIWPDGDELYNSFNSTRTTLRRQYGPTITLYRLQGEEEIIPDKHTLNWVHSTSYLKRFDKMFRELGEKRTVLKREVPIEDIVAVNVGKIGNYEEFVVLNRASTGLKLPTQLVVVS